MRQVRGWRVVEEVADDALVVHLIPEGSDPEAEERARKAVVAAQVRTILSLAAEARSLGIVDGDEDVLRRLFGA